MSCNFCEIANGYVDQESFRTLMLKMMKSLRILFLIKIVLSLVIV